MKKILITGGDGQLGKAFKSIMYHYKKYHFVIKSKKDLDITNLESLKKEIQKNNYDFIFNCAAYTDVNKAEKNKNDVMITNFESVKNILAVLKHSNSKLIQFSSDYVFDGDKKLEYTEQDQPNPINNYGHSKYLAEKYIIDSSCKSVIIRTSWLFSQFNNNFVKKILYLSKDNKSIKVTDKEIGCPTYAPDLANFCMKLCESKLVWDGEIFNFTNKGHTSRFTFAKTILDLIGSDCKVVTSEDYVNYEVGRPLNSKLSLKKIKSKFDINPRDWKYALSECLNEIL